MFSFLNNINIFTKIALGFLSVLTLLMLSSFFSYRSLNSIDDGFATYRHRVGIDRLISEVDRHFILFQHLVDEFALTGGDAQAVVIQQQRESQAAIIDAALTYARNPDRRATIEEIKQNFVRYSASLTEMMGLRRAQSDTVQNRLDPYSARIRAELEKALELILIIDSPAGVFLTRQALEQTTLLRAHYSKAIGQRNDKAAENLETAQSILISNVQRLMEDFQDPTTLNSLREASQLIMQYNNAGVEALNIERKLDRLVNVEMRGLADKIATDTAAVAASARTEQREIEEETSGLIDFEFNLSIGLAVTGFALGSLFAWVIGRGISRPLSLLSKAMGRLAGGEFDVTLPGLGRRDEVGDIAGAVERFKVRAMEKARAEADLKQESAHALASERKAAMMKLADAFEKLSVPSSMSLPPPQPS